LATEAPSQSELLFHANPWIDLAKRSILPEPARIPPR
jgi:hypothetical protein